MITSLIQAQGLAPAFLAPAYPANAQTPVPCATRATAPHIPGTSGAFTNLSNGTDTSATYRRSHTTTAGSTDYRFAYANYYNLSGVETDGLNDITVKASVELASGVLFPIRFQGQRSVTIKPGAMVWSDPVSLRIAKGTLFYSRTYVSVTSGQKWPLGMTEWHGLGDYNNRAVAQSTSVGADMTDTGTFSTNTDEAMYGPVAIWGATTSSPSPIIGIVSDSIGVGYLDYGTNDGWIVRALNGKYRFQHVGMSSGKIDDWSTPAKNYRRSPLLSPCTDIIVALGTNNIGGSLATNQPLMQTVFADFARTGRRVWVPTVPPYTTSTDSFVTTANQTVTANEANRVAMNNWIRTKPANVYGVIEVADVLETSRNSGIWKADGTAGNKLTTDGIHPNAAGSALAATAFNPIGLFGPNAI